MTATTLSIFTVILSLTALLVACDLLRTKLRPLLRRAR
jgi:hypothetical protein